MNTNELYNLYTQNYLVSTDTRKIEKNSLFFALKGDNFNGNTFAEKALSLGASYAIIDEKAYQTNERIILVDDVLKSLQELATHHRKKLQIPIIGLTGSNGKTTSKELIAAVLQKKYKTQFTKGNLNNHIGVPLTILSITPTYEMAVIEMGANHQKEIEFLSSISQPDFGYITNFGKAHLEGFGGVEGVIKGKSELYNYLKANHKTAIVNPNDAIQVAKTATINSIYFVKNIQFVSDEPFVSVKVGETQIISNLIGAYNFANIAAAITIGLHFKIDIQDIKSALESYVPQNNRSQIITGKTHQLVMDAYNANPSSMQVALESFAKQTGTNKVLILGDMFELGEDSAKEHQFIIDLVAELQFKTAFFLGKNFCKAKTEKYLQFETFEDFESYIKNNPLNPSSILIKGSRGMKLERCLEILN